MGVKKIRTIFMRYMLIIAGGILTIFAVNLGGYLVCVHFGIVVSVAGLERQISAAAENLETINRVSREDVPFFCDYALFLPDGTYEYGSLDRDRADDLWRSCMENSENSAAGYRFEVIDRGNGILILQYRYTAQFRNAALRRIIPTADLFLVTVMAVEVIELLFMVSHSFGRYTGRRLDNLSAALRRIEEQDLDFQMESCGIFEIDQALDAIEHMKQALKKSLDEQWQADKLQQDRISALAHDLKTPLTIIRGNAELLYDTPLSEEQRECADYVKVSAAQMQNYVQMLIDITRTKQDFGLSKKSVPIPEFLAEIKVQAKGMCSVKNIRLEWNESCRVREAAFDNEQLTRAIMNIISNAVDHTPAGGKITFSAYENENILAFDVCDTGKGFSVEALKRAAEQFYMDDQSRTSRAHYGIGLYITDLIVKQHGGELKLENFPETGGAKVTITIPLIQKKRHN